jgi:hypothetical protein
VCCQQLNEPNWPPERAVDADRRRIVQVLEQVFVVNADAKAPKRRPMVLPVKLCDRRALGICGHIDADSLHVIRPRGHDPSGGGLPRRYWIDW